jgi:hypothetical protein
MDVGNAGFAGVKTCPCAAGIPAFYRDPWSINRRNRTTDFPTGLASSQFESSYGIVQFSHIDL